MVAYLDRISGKIKKKLNFLKDTPNQSSIYTKDRLTGANFEIGEYTYGCPNVVQWDDSTNLHIGKFCSIASDVTILLGGNHRTDWVSSYPFNVLSKPFPKASPIKGHPATKGDIWIGNDVWIGHGATILSGVHIGDGAVIGAKTVVTKDVAPYAIVVGNPGRMVKKRFDEKTIAALLEIGWWNWDEKQINDASHLICNSDIHGFIDKYSNK